MCGPGGGTCAAPTVGRMRPTAVGACADGTTALTATAPGAFRAPGAGPVRRDPKVLRLRGLAQRGQLRALGELLERTLLEL